VIEFIKAGGFLMYPLLLCSLIASAIIVERFWSLRRKKVAPRGLAAQAWGWVKNGTLEAQRIETLRTNSPLGRILAAGLINHRHSREVMKESLEEVGGQVVHELGRYLNALGTIAAISPLLGLLGTVFGMIEVFATITTQGVGNASALAGGISQALITTATGLSIAIPALLFYRYFRARVESLVVTMEQEALRLVEVIHNDREASDLERSA
jgi:biopolymer transport protein ExbB